MLRNSVKSLQYVRKSFHRSVLQIRQCSSGNGKRGETPEEQLYERYKDQIQYSSFIDDNSIQLGFRRKKILESRLDKARRNHRTHLTPAQPIPMSLEQLFGERLRDPSPVDAEEWDNVEDYFPYHKLKRKAPKAPGMDEFPKEELIPTTGQWMSDYEYYDEADEEGRRSFYGTPDPKEPVSNIPCGGCGAYLQCAEPSIPGYLPGQLFKGRSKQQLQTSICQRCHFLKRYNTAINVTVSPDEYVEMISSIRDKKALVLLLVDVLDFPCSIWPGLSEILGPDRSIIVVGNKVDLLPRDCPGYLDNIRCNLTKTFLESGFTKNNIKHVSLISATSGYGVEQLITKTHNVWGSRGDIYLVGCTNVGKSSLFNALLRSDLCKTKASDLIQRATACPWPGTTLKMLKFPILRPSDQRLYLRTKRLKAERRSKIEDEIIRKDRPGGLPHFTPLAGRIGQTFAAEKTPTADHFSLSAGAGGPAPIPTMNEENEEFVSSKWCYDTPGVVQPEQILNLLTTPELLMTLPRQIIRPRAFLMKTRLTLFLAGLGRLDYIEGPQSTRVLLYASHNLPTLICETSAAQEIYQNLLGTELLRVPRANPERLAKWPPLQAAPDILLYGDQKHLSVADVVLSSAGWIAINLPYDSEAVFRAWTPERRGIFVRQPALLPYGMALRGKRIRGSLAYREGNTFVK